MTVVYVMIALVVGVLVGAGIVYLVMRSQGQSATSQILAQVERIGVVFTHPGQRGRAGEIALENLLEISGMGQHRDFDLQVTLPEGGRPDVVLNLPGRGCLVIDAKFPLDDFQRAVSAKTEEERRRALAAHGKAVALHVTQLAKRDYTSKLPDALDFMVCYVPSEDLVTAAYEARPNLFYDAARDHILLAGPVALLAILWGIVHGLQQDARVRHAREIGESAAELHRRLGGLVPPLQKLGRSVTAVVNSYNAFLASLEGRVLPEARRLENLGIFAPGTQLPEITALDAQTRSVAAERYPAAGDPGTSEQRTSEDDGAALPPD